MILTLTLWHQQLHSCVCVCVWTSLPPQEWEDFVCSRVQMFSKNSDWNQVLVQVLVLVGGLGSVSVLTHTVTRVCVCGCVCCHGNPGPASVCGWWFLSHYSLCDVCQVIWNQHHMITCCVFLFLRTWCGFSFCLLTESEVLKGQSDIFINCLVSSTVGGLRLGPENSSLSTYTFPNFSWTFYKLLLRLLSCWTDSHWCVASWCCGHTNRTNIWDLCREQLRSCTGPSVPQVSGRGLELEGQRPSTGGEWGIYVINI